MTRKSFVVGLFLALLSAASADNARAQQPSSAAPTSEGRGISLPALLQEVGGRLHKTFLLDPRGDAVKVELVNLREQDISYPQLLSLLGLRGFVVIPSGTTLQVIPNVDARQAAVPIVTPDHIKELDDEIVTCVFAVKNISATQLVPILRPLLPTWGHLAAVSDRNALIIVDRSANVKGIIEIVRILQDLPKVPVTEPQKSP
jgi:general secretion pathway protein D